MTRGTLQSDDRAVSIAVTHILTIGITTILITGLLVAGSGLLEGEKSDATRSELRTIGNRLGAEMSSAYYTAQDSEQAEVTVRATHPEFVAGDSYNVELREDCTDIPGYGPGNTVDCIVMKPPQGQDEVKVPLDPDVELASEKTVQGGTVYVVVEDTDGDDDPEVTIEKSLPDLAPTPEVRR